MRLVSSAIMGAILGAIFAKLTFLQAWTLIPWGLVNLSIGYFSTNKKAAVQNGVIYGFFLGLVFMAVGYNGTDPVVTKLPFFVVIGLFCAVFGTTISWVGFWLKNKLNKSTIDQEK